MNATNDSPNPRNVALPPALLGAIAVSAVLLILVGGSLLFFPDFARPRWVWQIAPYNSGFLGAVYLSAAVPLVALLWVRRWSPARPILFMMWAFVTHLLVVSFAYDEAFNFARRATGLWFGLYLSDCLVITYYLGRLWERPVPTEARARRWSSLLRAQATCFGVYGAGLLGYPEFFSGFWPWALDAFHGRLYSAIFISGAIGCGLLSRTATISELKILGALQTSLGVSIVVALLLVDARAGRVGWGDLGTWVWLGAFASLAALGVAALLRAK